MSTGTTTTVGTPAAGAYGDPTVLGQHAPYELLQTVAVVPAPPSDDLRDDLTPQDVSPGLLGFVVIFAAAIACIPLFWSMVRKLRKVDPRRERATTAAPGAGEERVRPADEPAASTGTTGSDDATGGDGSTERADGGSDGGPRR